MYTRESEESPLYACRCQATKTVKGGRRRDNKPAFLGKIDYASLLPESSATAATLLRLSKTFHFISIYIRRRYLVGL